MEVFIGNIIKEITEQRGMPKSELGRRLHMTPTNVHKIFKRESIDTALLQKISEVLDYDFFKHYTDYKASDNVTNYVSEAEARYKTALEQCREKVAMLEKINGLLEEKLQNMNK